MHDGVWSFVFVCGGGGVDEAGMIWLCTGEQRVCMVGLAELSIGI